MNLPLPIRIVLWPFAKVYGAFVRARRAFYRSGKLKTKSLKAAVISIGNLTVGGTGKTPMVLWLAAKFLGQGKKVAILTRGYKGSKGSSDEVELLKRRLEGKIFFGVGPDRFASGSLLESQHAVDVFLLDDGFQHLPLARTIDIVMLDGSRKLTDEWLLPAGSLREPVDTCRYADILVVTRKTEKPDIKNVDLSNLPVFYAHTRLIGFQRFGPDPETIERGQLGAGPFVAFCGIGNPGGFFEDLKRWQVPIVEKRVFPDHHRYSSMELDRLQARSQACGAAGLITTEKDAENFPFSNVAFPIWIAVIELVVDGEKELLALIDRKLAERHGAAA